MRDQATDTGQTDAGGCGTGARNRFFRGKRMKAGDFEKEQQYAIERRRLVTRAVVGWGVVQGLPVHGARKSPDRTGRQDTEQEGYERRTAETRPEPGPIGVGAGLAFDRHGREAVLPGRVRLDAKNTFVVEDGAGGCKVRTIEKLEPGRYLLSINYAERRFGDADLPDACGCDGPEKRYVCETVVFSLTSLRGCDCPCAEDECRRPCTCGFYSRCAAIGRGPHSCLCQWITDSHVHGETPALCEWREYWVDPADGVPLACVTVELKDDKCDPAVVGWIDDDCGPRRLVKGNDLLYDLIRGCDLTRIDWVSWHEWHRSPERVSWQKFADMFSDDGSTNFIVKFSRPVLRKTLQRDVIAITAVTTEQATGWRVLRRVPVVGIDHDPDPQHANGTGLPPGTTNQMRVKVRPEWVRDEIERGRESWLSERNFRIEIEIHGDLILDCHRQAVDANAVGLRAVPTGNGTPGGTYLSNFRVERKQRRESYDGE